jgi:hypothetical protein
LYRRGIKWQEVGENCIMGSVIICTLRQLYLEGRIVKEDEIGSACSKHGEKRNARMISVGKPEGKRPLNFVDIFCRIILRWIR